MKADQITNFPLPIIKKLLQGDWNLTGNRSGCRMPCHRNKFNNRFFKNAQLVARNRFTWK